MPAFRNHQSYTGKERLSLHTLDQVCLRPALLEDLASEKAQSIPTHAAVKAPQEG